MGDTMREQFEKFAQDCPMGRFSVDRKGEGYWSSHTQIMWDTWKAAHEAGRQQGMEQERALWLMANDAAERKLYERITTTQQAGDCDKPRHVCGAQGFGALGDVCPACEQRDIRKD